MSMSLHFEPQKNMFQKIIGLNWGLIIVVCTIAFVGLTALYSAGGGSLDPWASRQGMRFVLGFFLMVGIALIDIKWWFRLSWPAYAAGLLLLIVVEVFGHVGMGAQRWINLGFMKLQPSEFMKIAVVMVLARYFHDTTYHDTRKVLSLILPAIIVLIPVALVMLQPDLGTSLMIVFCAAGMFFIAGAPIWLYLAGGSLVAASIPVAWQFMHEYQKKRVMTFLNPESDPLGSGYHITQSKIALGSGGLEGRGFLQGTQSHLNFLPEKQTDFIFTLWAEEWGLAGGVALLVLFGLIFIYGVWISVRMKQNFARYMVLGLSINFSLYVFINIGMVMGLLPVVGAPLPLVSYGGTSMLAAMVGFGLMMSCHIHRESRV